LMRTLLAHFVLMLVGSLLVCFEFTWEGLHFLLPGSTGSRWGDFEYYKLLIFLHSSMQMFLSCVCEWVMARDVSYWVSFD
jgi:hypothetical protein